MAPSPPQAGEDRARPKLRISKSNVLRHTISTKFHRLRLPDPQMDSASGHASTGTDKRDYRNLCPDYLQEFVAAVEYYWRRVDRFTTAHRHPSTMAEVVPLENRRRIRRRLGGWPAAGCQPAQVIDP